MTSTKINYKQLSQTPLRGQGELKVP